MLVAQNSLGPVCPVPLTVRGSDTRVARTPPRIFFDLDRLVKVFFAFLDERRRRKDFLGILRLLLVNYKKKNKILK